MNFEAVLFFKHQGQNSSTQSVVGDSASKGLVRKNILKTILKKILKMLLKIFSQNLTKIPDKNPVVVDW